MYPFYFPPLGATINNVSFSFALSVKKKHSFHSSHLQSLLKLQQICGSEGQTEELQVRFLQERPLPVAGAGGRGVQEGRLLHRLEKSHWRILWCASHPITHIVLWMSLVYVSLTVSVFV